MVVQNQGGSAGAKPKRPPGRPPGGTEEAFRARRHEILRAAAQMFNERGFHETSLSDLADRLHVTKPSIYYYVESKDALLFECSGVALAQMQLAVAEIATCRTGLERIETFFRHYTRLICDDFGRCLALTDPRWLEPDSRKANLAGRRALTKKVAEYLEEGIADGSIGPCDPRLTTYTLFSAFNGIARWWKPGRDPAPDAMAAITLGTFTTGLKPRRD
jgi:AcrR family transcriptional regulator